MFQLHPSQCLRHVLRFCHNLKLTSGKGSMLSNVGKLACLIFIVARVGVISAQSMADTYESASATLSVTSSNAGQYYVAPTGRDSNNGSAAHPWATIAHAFIFSDPATT